MPSPRYTIAFTRHGRLTGELLLPIDDRGNYSEPYATIGDSPILAEFTTADGATWAWAIVDGRPHTFRRIGADYIASPYLHGDGTYGE
jgi:hypothetical protein